MNPEWHTLEELIAADAARLRARAPVASPLPTWHAARANMAWRTARRLRWIGIGLSALTAAALLPVLWQARFTLWWLLPLGVVFWPLRALFDAPPPSAPSRSQA